MDSERPCIYIRRVRVAKPERRIFELVQEKLKLQPQEFCYVGDSYENDIRRCRREPDGMPSGTITEIIG